MIDLKRCIFVIDSTTIAFMVSILAKGEPVNCIFERKTGIDSDYTYNLFLNFAKKCLNINHYEEIQVPNPFFLEGTNYFSRVYNIKKFSREIKKVFIEASDTVYVGPSTSSIMNCLQCSPDKIYYLYHGTGDYFRYYTDVEKNTGALAIIKQIIKKTVVGNFLHLSNSRWAGFFSLQGFSLADLHSPTIKWLDYRQFNSDYIEHSLRHINNKTKDEKWLMFCPIHDLHNKDGISGNVSKYNNINIKLLRKYLSDNENVMFKCHPSIYSMNDSISNDLNTELMNAFRVDVKDVIEDIPDEIGGAMLPIEVLFKYCSFTKLVCVESSTIWILKSDKSILKVVDLTLIDESRKNNLLTIIDCFLKHNMIDENYVISK